MFKMKINTLKTYMNQRIALPTFAMLRPSEDNAHAKWTSEKRKP